MNWDVPYLGLPLQFKHLKPELMKEFERVMSEGSFILRNDLKEFEKRIASYLGVKHIIGVGSGYDALYLSLIANDITTGEVITVEHTFVATHSAIVHAGAEPVFVDTRYDYNINVNKIEEKITKDTKAIMPVHLNGRSCQMDVLMEIADKHGLIVIEDAAQSLGAMYKQKKVGSFGTGCFSLHPMKVLSCAGDGGFVSTNDAVINQKIRELRNHGRTLKKEYVCYGYNSRLDNLQAALLNVKFTCLEDWINRRREIADMYSERLSDLPLVLPPKLSNADYYDIYSSYVIGTDKQQELFNYLRNKRIEVFIHTSHLGVLSLPIYPEMTDEQMMYVVRNIYDFYRGGEA